jgi:deoxyadenosine/deoxycytidine kinase
MNVLTIQKFGPMNLIESPYRYVAIEGNIGAGKTSLSNLISKDFNAKLILEQFEDNSFLPKFYQDQERYAFPLELSFLAERFQQLRDGLSISDLFSNFIISDYFINKSLIFSRKTLQPDEFKLYQKLFDIINQSMVKPDLVVYLYAQIDQLQTNIRKRGRSYEQNIQDQYLQQIQESYFEFIKQQSQIRILIIDTHQIDFVNNPKHYEWMVQEIFKFRPLGVHRISFENL